MAERHQGPVATDRWFLGSRLRVVSDAVSSGGLLTVLEQWAPAGFSPPLPVHHREDTALHVLEGELTVVVGAVTTSVGPREMPLLPRDVPHTFRVDSDGAHFLEYATPGGVEAFSRYGGEIRGPPLEGGPTADGATDV